MIVSPSCGFTFAWISAPAVPGMKNVDPGLTDRCFTWKTGSFCSRNFFSTELACAAAASAPSSSIAPPGK